MVNFGMKCTFQSQIRLKNLNSFQCTRALANILQCLGYMTLVPSQKVDKKLTFPSQQNYRKYTSMVIQRKKEECLLLKKNKLGWQTLEYLIIFSAHDLLANIRGNLRVLYSISRLKSLNISLVVSYLYYSQTWL